MIKVLFVCMGNICRSPTAEGVLRKILMDNALSHLVQIDSAGTHAYHVDQPPDHRAQEAAARRGIDLSALRGRLATAEDIQEFDYVLAMDRDNYQHLVALSGDHQHIRLLLDYSEQFDVEEVPDPYYGGLNGFDRVLDMIEDACNGLMADIRTRHGRSADAT